MKYWITEVQKLGPFWLLTLVPRSKDDEPINLIITTTYWQKLKSIDIERISKAIKSDGCSNVPEFYHPGCVMHDFWYRTHQDFSGETITKAEADKRFRLYIQSKSKFGRFSPMSWWRWLGVKWFGQKAWSE